MDGRIDVWQMSGMTGGWLRNERIWDGVVDGGWGR